MTMKPVTKPCLVLFQKAGASSAFVWSGGGVTGGGGQDQAAAQPAAVPTGKF